MSWLRTFSLPESTAQNATSIAVSFIPHSRSSGASGVPTQRQLPIAPVKPGAEPLPEHSIVAVTSCFGRSLISASVSSRGRSTCPATRSFHCSTSIGLGGG